MKKTLSIVIVLLVLLSEANAETNTDEWKGRSIEFVATLCYDISKDKSDLYNPPRVSKPIFSFKVLKESYNLLLLNLLKNDALIKDMPERVRRSINTENSTTSEYKALKQCSEYLMRTYTPNKLWKKASKMEVLKIEIENNLRSALPKMKKNEKKTNTTNTTNTNASWKWNNNWWENATVPDIKRMLNNGNNIHDKYNKHKKNKKMCGSWDGRTPLMFASASSSADVVEFLIKKGANVNYKTTCRDNYAYTALRLAIYNKNLDVINTLINAGAKTEIKLGGFKQTVLSEAVSYHNLQIVKILINAGANLNTKDKFGNSLAIKATHNKNINVLKYILSKLTEDVNKLLLEASARNNNYEVIKLLLNMGANIDTKDTHGRTPLMLASKKENNNKVIKKILQQSQENINMKDKQGNTALMYASGWGRGSSRDLSVENIKILLNHDADLSITNEAGYSVLDAAISYHKKGKSNGNSKLEILLRDVISKKGLFTGNHPTNIDVISAVKNNSSIYSKCNIKKGVHLDKSIGIKVIKKEDYHKEGNYYPYKIQFRCREKSENWIKERSSIKIFHSKKISGWVAEKFN